MKSKVTILFLISLLNTSLFGQTNIIQKMENNMQKWESVIKNGDIQTIDSLIKEKAKFDVPISYINEFKNDTIKNDLPIKILYYCLKMNMLYLDKFYSLQESLNIQYVTNYYLSYKLENIWGDRVSFLFHVEEQYPNRLSNADNKDLVLKSQGNIDSLLLDIENVKYENKQVLAVLKHILDKGYKLNYTMTSRLIFAGTDWGINPLSTIFFYDNLYNYPDYFTSDVDLENYKPEHILLAYLPSTNPDKDFLSYLIKKSNLSNIDSICQQIYPIGTIDELGDDLFDVTIPSYESEKYLLPIYPKMSEYSGHNLLHAAIVNADVQQVKDLIKENRILLEIQTDPIREYFNYKYGDKAYTPIELAHYVEEQLKKKYEEDSFYQTLPYRFKLKQIKKIINILNDEPQDKGLVWTLPYSIID